MFKALRERLKKSVEKITKRVEEKEEVEKTAVQQTEALVEEKLEHAEPTKEGIERVSKRETEEKEVLYRPEETDIPKQPEPTEHEHKELPPAKIKKVKKRALSLATKLLTDEELDDVLWDLQVGLLENDVAVETAEKICARVREELGGEVVKRRRVEEAVKKGLREAVTNVLQQKAVDLVEEIQKAKRPYKIVFLGFNGSGKTTTIARLARLLQKNGLTCVLAAGDTWRAAAIQQLEKHGDALGARVIKHDYGSDATAVIFDAVRFAETNGIDVVLADTTGRSHTNRNLMDELHKIVRVIKPDKRILIVDSLTGNDAVEQARAFERSVGVDGIILTKMDVNEKGGAALSVAHTIGKPVLYVGVGQGYDDLERFDPQRVAKALLE